MKNIAKSLALFHKEMHPVGKDRANPFFKSRYATLDNILEAIKEPLEKAGLTFIQVPEGKNILKTVIIDVESGETIVGTMELSPVKDDPQSQGSAYTYARRYSLSMMLGIATEDDDDANSATKTVTHETAAKLCTECKKPHTGQYPRCLDCFKRGAAASNNVKNPIQP